jgi:hypothetical protein
MTRIVLDEIITGNLTGIADRLQQYQVKGIGLGWYTPESWKRLCAIADDRKHLANTYADFVVGAEKKVADLANQGFVVKKVMIDVYDMVRWCRQNGYRNDRRGRAAYGAHQAALGDMPAEGKA